MAELNIRSEDYMRAMSRAIDYTSPNNLPLHVFTVEQRKTWSDRLQKGAELATVIRNIAESCAPPRHRKSGPISYKIGEVPTSEYFARVEKIVDVHQLMKPTAVYRDMRGAPVAKNTLGRIH